MLPISSSQNKRLEDLEYTNTALVLPKQILSPGSPLFRPTDWSWGLCVKNAIA